MKAALYMILVLGLVPLQATFLHHAEILGVTPDLVFIAVCLIGFLAGTSEGALAGIALGFIQDMFSAGPWGLNLATKGLVGLLAGLVGRQVTNATSLTVVILLLSLAVASGLIVLFAVESDIGARLSAVQHVLLPEIVLNAVLGMGCYWLLPARAFHGRGAEREPAGLVF